MTATPEQIGPYTIDRELGRGGMGVVYLGHDTRLGRKVAIKALPEHLADDPERLARFEREARTLASLNHPGIAGIYGVEEHEGRRYLVLEYVEGLTLAERLDRGPLPPDETLEIALQIAAGVEAAHEAGVVHRDLKPGNIIMTPDGKAKVLDFGLARTDDDASSTGSSMSPTMTSPARPTPTVEGMLLGTAAYMSPEQARGRRVDRRTDIWSFGVILYEMLTADSPFRGETVSDSIGAILHKDIDLDRLPQGTPPTIRRVLVRCLERDRDLRYRDIGDVRLDLRSPVNEAQPQAGASDRGGLSATAVVGVAVVALAVGAAGAVVGLGLMRSAPPVAAGPAVKRFALNGFGMPVDAFESIALSPQGDLLAVRGESEDGEGIIFLRPLDSLEMIPVPDSTSGWLPFFSPDGESIAFFALGELKAASVRGGAARVICVAPNGFTGGAWLEDGSIVFSGAGDPFLIRVPSSGGEMERIDVSVDSQSDFITGPAPLPGHNAVLCSVRRGGRFDIAVISLVDGAMQVLTENGFNPVYSPSGHILFQQGNEGPLMAAPFDIDRLAVTGRPFTVEPRIASRIGIQVQTFAAANDGTIAFISPEVTRDTGSLVWVDMTGVVTPITQIDRTIDMPRLSHDGTRIAFRTPSPNCDIWVHDIRRGATARLTSEGDNHGAVWSADDNFIYTFRRSFVNGSPLRIRSDGAGSPEPLLDEEIDHGYMMDVSLDGRIALVGGQNEGTGWDVGSIDIPSGSVSPLLRSRFDEAAAVISPDGALLAYTSTESGRSEIYVQPFPELSSRVQVSIEGGEEPVWSRDGRTLFFRYNRVMYAADVAVEPELEVARPRRLFEGAYASGAGSLAGYDVSADGERFVMVRRDDIDNTSADVVVMLNWFSELADGTRPPD